MSADLIKRLRDELVLAEKSLTYVSRDNGVALRAMIAEADAHLFSVGQSAVHVLTADEWAKWKALYAAMHLGAEHVRRFQMGSTADIALDAIDGGTFNAELAT